MSGPGTFQTFTETHPDLWSRIGEAWHDRADVLPRGRYLGLREAVCIVGGFTVETFEAECERAFG